MPRFDSISQFTPEELQFEEWRPVIGYENGYRVSSLGRVRSLPRKGFWRGGIRPLVQSRTGHLRITLSRSGKPKTFWVHKLVAAAFVGPRPTGLEVRHLDGISFNNRYQNLKYGTRTENAEDRLRHGHHSQANQIHCLNGHPFTEKNTWKSSSKAGRKGRTCRTCHQIRAQARWRKLHPKVQYVRHIANYIG